ncbi:PP0621 family protein [Aquabacterium sp.]|jgi:uncharacterized protein|uniref:PP0621 family protein n=1 Tax=Aquabacterium sp. TaxID=1872578 RepID=UPI000AA65299|nr:PP0621 family protein [Aquabacterium sp.]
MLKYLLIAVVVIWLLYSPILRRARQLKRDRRTAAPTAAPGPAKAPQVEDMVACAHCGVHLPASEAFRDAVNRPYCSDVHRIAGPSARRSGS